MLKCVRLFSATKEFTSITDTSFSARFNLCKLTSPANMPFLMEEIWLWDRSRSIQFVMGLKTPGGREVMELSLRSRNSKSLSPVKAPLSIREIWLELRSRAMHWSRWLKLPAGRWSISFLLKSTFLSFAMPAGIARCPWPENSQHPTLVTERQRRKPVKETRNPHKVRMPHSALLTVTCCA